jgi:hypothetical protein
MSYLRVKTIKNRKYLYRQTSVRKGKKVKTIGLTSAVTRGYFWPRETVTAEFAFPLEKRESNST